MIRCTWIESRNLVLKQSVLVEGVKLFKDIGVRYVTSKSPRSILQTTPVPFPFYGPLHETATAVIL